MRAAALLALLALAATLAACAGGGGSSDRPGADATLVLDFAPNAVHSGIYLATSRGYDEAEGVRIRVRAPGASSDGVKLLAAGRADLAILDIHDLAIARARGRDLVAVMAIVQRPLASVIAQPDVRRPRALAGRRVGVTGLPSDDAVLDAVVRGDGGDPRAVRRITIGFGAVPALLGRRVAAATAFWNAEGVALRRRRPGIRVFRVDDFGAPRYPELVLAMERRRLEEDPALARAVVRTLVRGYRETLVDPASAVAALAAGAPGVDPGVARAELDAVSPVLAAPGGRVGALDPAALRAWARWEAATGIVPRPPDVDRAFAFGLAPAG